MSELLRNPGQVAAVINAGGRGTRLKTALSKVWAPADVLAHTKAMTEIQGLKLIDHHVRRLRGQGFENIVVSAGDHPEVKEHVENNYSRRHITALTFPEEHGTAGDLIKIIRSNRGLMGKRMLVQNVDTFLDFDPHALLSTQAWQFSEGKIATMALTTRKGVPNEGSFSVAMDGTILGNLEAGVDTQPGDMVRYRASSTGAFVMETDYLEDYDWDGRSQVDLYKQVFGAQVILNRQLAGYNNGDRLFMDVGTETSYRIAQDPSGPITDHLHRGNIL